MKLPALFWFLCWSLILVSSGSLAAQMVKVRNIEFNDTFRQADEDWLQMEVELRANQKNPDPEAINENYLTNVLVEVTMAYKNPQSDSEQKFLFFRNSITLAALEQGNDRTTYFFLPGEVIEMYDLPNRPPYAYVRFEVEGEEIPPNENHLYDKLKPNMLESFKQMADNYEDQTEGMLVNMLEAPWYVMDEVELDEVPAFILKKSEF